MECRSYLSFQKLFWTVLGCALPARVDGIRGYAPTQGRSPGMIRVLPPVGRSRHRTSGGTAANRGFHIATPSASRTTSSYCISDPIDKSVGYFHSSASAD